MQRTTFSSRRLAAASIFGLALAVGACSDDNNDNNSGLPAATTYAGFVASTNGQLGPLAITFASPVAAPPINPSAGTGPSFSSGAPVAANGTVSINGGAAVAISGTLDGGTLNMTGAGWTLTGSLLNGQIVGTFTAPGGVTGSLSAVASSADSPAKTYCGYYEGTDLTNDPPTTVSGTFSVVIAGDILLGTAVDDEDQTVFDFSGTATSTGFNVHEVVTGGELNATGTYDADHAEGTFNTKAGSTTVTTGAFVGYPYCTPS
jgi:hypothetical protein